MQRRNAFLTCHADEIGRKPWSPSTWTDGRRTTELRPPPAATEAAASSETRIMRVSLILMPAIFVSPGASLNTDEFNAYMDLKPFAHAFVNHLESYVNGRTHTNGMENFWSLPRRTLGAHTLA